jgi:hypothetical protein
VQIWGRGSEQTTDPFPVTVAFIATVTAESLTAVSTVVVVFLAVVVAQLVLVNTRNRIGNNL